MSRKRGVRGQSRLLKAKKAQLTVFIILGLLFVLTAVLIFYLTTAAVRVEKAVAVPREQRPVYDFVVECLKSVAHDAIVQMGQQSGYLVIPDSIARSPASYVPADPTGTFKIPFWYYLGEDRSPSIGDMERAISRNVEDNLRECLGNFTAFKDLRISEIGNMSAKTTIAEKNVVVELEWPLELASEKGIERITRYTALLDVRLKEAYDLAQRFMTAENTHKLLEQKTIDLMALNPDIPMNGLEFTCEQKVWFANDIKTMLQTMLRDNIPVIRIKNTAYPPFDEPLANYEKLKAYSPQDILANRVPKHTPEDAYEFFNLFFEVGQPPTDLKATLLYSPDWGMDFDVQPSDNGVLKSNVARGVQKYLPFLCINQYHFVYDIIYPVVLRVKDEQAFKGEGFVFQIAFPVLINNNEGNRIAVPIKRFETRKFPLEFCKSLSNQVVDVRAIGLEQGYVTELKDVNMTFRCFDQLCPLGKTTADPTAGARRLFTKIPEGCTNAFIRAEKAGYLANEQQLTEDVLAQDKVVIPLTALKTMKIKVLKHGYYAPEKRWLTEPRELREGEEVSIAIIARNKQFEQFIDYPTTKSLELIQEDSNYDITVMLRLFGRMTGGYAAENLPIRFSDIDGKEVMIIHVFEYLPMAFDRSYDNDVVSYLYQGGYQQMLKPEFE
ncbi:MAG: hypothetical protein QW559_00500 [Candidatus Woesearchaeota archaeon]